RRRRDRDGGAGHRGATGRGGHRDGRRRRVGVVHRDGHRGGGRRVAGGIACDGRQSVTAVGRRGRIPRDAVRTRRVFGSEIRAVHLELHAHHADVFARRRRDRDGGAGHRG